MIAQGGENPKIRILSLLLSFTGNTSRRYDHMYVHESWQVDSIEYTIVVGQFSKS